jgi:hypothetical protein
MQDLIALFSNMLDDAAMSDNPRQADQTQDLTRAFLTTA